MLRQIFRIAFCKTSAFMLQRGVTCFTPVQHVPRFTTLSLQLAISLLCRWAVAMRSRRLAGLALLLKLPAHVAAVVAITNANIKTAATAWVTNPTTARATYGPIADWNTAAATSMADLFYAKPQAFNDDISKWNVASVANMYQVCARACVQLRSGYGDPPPPPPGYFSELCR